MALDVKSLCSAAAVLYVISSARLAISNQLLRSLSRAQSWLTSQDQERLSKVKLRSVCRSSFGRLGR